MKRRPVEWLPRSGDDDDDESSGGEVRSMTFEIIDQWVATDADQLLLPIRVVEKSGVKIEAENGYTGILKQYGGENLLNDMLMAAQENEDVEFNRGSRWTLWRDGGRLEIEPEETDE